MRTAGGVVTKLRTARACHHCKVYRGCKVRAGNAGGGARRPTPQPLPPTWPGNEDCTKQTERRSSQLL
jgi:hypothetical protein